MNADYIYVALLDCGCCEGAAKSIDPTVVEWIDAGLAVKRVTFAEWRERYMPGFLSCPHRAMDEPEREREDPAVPNGQKDCDATETSSSSSFPVAHDRRSLRVTLVLPHRDGRDLRVCHRKASGMPLVCCKFTAPDKQPCPAFCDERSPRGYCFAHEEIYLHDCAVAFRKKRRKDRPSAEAWARSMRLNVDRMNAMADTLPIREQPIALVVQ